MPTWVKVVLIVVLVGFTLLVGGVIVAARWVRSKGETLKEQGKAVVAEAEKFAETHTEAECVTESLNRLRSCPGFICEAKLKVFLTTCLNASEESPELCENVPGPDQLVQGTKWQLAECQRRGWPNNQRCMRMVNTVQVFCTDR
jgi:hypothetical protein